MKKWLRKAAFILTLLLVLQMAAPVPAEARGGEYLTAVNEKVLDMDEATMPFWQGNELYVSNAVFVNGELGVYYGRTFDRQTAQLSSLRQNLYFELGRGLCYDQQNRFYEAAAITRGNYVFFPLSMVADFFNLEWQYLSAAPVPLIRIKSSSARLSDEEFLDAGAGLLRSKYNAYRQSLQAEEPSTPAQPSVSHRNGQQVYLMLAYSNLIDCQTVLDILEDSGKCATFVMTAGEMADRGDLLRRIVGQGHAVAVSLVGMSQEEAVQELAAANGALWSAACAKTRLVYLTEEQKALAPLVQSLGYTVCQTDVDYSPYPLTSSSRAARLYGRLADYSSREVSVYLGAETGCTKGLGALLSRLESGECRVLAYRETVG